jgi:hypothetical protein
MNLRQQLKARLIAQLGMDLETGAWIAQTIRMLSTVEIEYELAFILNTPITVK